MWESICVMRRFSLDWNVFLEFVGCLLFVCVVFAILVCSIFAILVYPVFAILVYPIFAIPVYPIFAILIPPISAMTQISPSRSVLN
jgi:hypothetical protein